MFLISHVLKFKYQPYNLKDNITADGMYSYKVHIFIEIPLSFSPDNTDGLPDLTLVS
jgi:hypothetical protein